MLKFFNYSKKNSLNNLEIILNKRKFIQKNESSLVKKIISDVRINGDKSVIKYEKKFSKLQIKSNKIVFSKKEINQISKKIDKKVKQ